MASQTATLLLLAIFSFAGLAPTTAAASIPSVFVFGDSTFDVGNNNFLPPGTVKANFLPYGVDFVPAMATGRFSNGLNPVDYLAKMMGLKQSPPPFLSLNATRLEKEARRGINFASGGSGILENTGSAKGEIISMGKQVKYFETIRSNLTAQMGTVAAEKLLSRSIFLISTGSNDLLEAGGPLNQTRRSTLIANLGLTYKGHLRTLYNLGARRLGVISIPPIGCCPALRSMNASGGCVDDLNKSARQFHLASKAMLRDLSSELRGMKYALGNAYQIVTSFFENPIPFGLKEIKTACCGAGRFNGESPCLPTSTYCSNRSQYLFWDSYHLTQASSKLAAQSLYGGSKKFVSPINFDELAKSS